MVSCLTNIENSKEVGRLSRGSKHCCHSTLQCTNLCCHCIIGRILQSGIKIPLCLQIKQFTHFLTGIIFKGCTLINRQLSCFSLRRLPALVNTFCSDSTFHSLLTPSMYSILVSNYTTLTITYFIYVDHLFFTYNTLFSMAIYIFFSISTYSYSKSINSLK